MCRNADNKFLFRNHSPAPSKVVAAASQLSAISSAIARLTCKMSHKANFSHLPMLACTYSLFFSKSMSTKNSLYTVLPLSYFSQFCLIHIYFALVFFCLFFFFFVLSTPMDFAFALQSLFQLACE